jgi:D-alanyl-D-alanine carboxypeptidase
VYRARWHLSPLRGVLRNASTNLQMKSLLRPLLLRSLGATLLAAAVATCVSAQPARAPVQKARLDTADRFIEAEMARTHIPGVAIAVVRAGRVIKAQGYGVADIEHRVPATPNTVFKIGSVSKQFIASGIMLLAQDGRLSVDDLVSKHVPGTPDTWSTLTLRHFLTHTSGVVREGPAFAPNVVQPDSVVIQSAFPAPLAFAPGTKYQYCNVCYFTLADIIRRASGTPWEQFFTDRIFTPLGMTSTRTTTSSVVIPHRARGYVWQKDRYVNADDYLAVRPSGAFISTVLDLAKWDAALYTDRVLTASSREAMWTPVRLRTGSTHPYGFGWLVDELDGHPHIHHGGSLPGFRAEMARFPKDSLTIIVLTNADGAAPAQITAGLARIYLGQPRLRRAVNARVSPSVLRG